jgi:hypothetical protein
MELPFSKLDAASADQRPKWKRIAENIVEIRFRGIESDVAASILLSLVAALDVKLAGIYERAAFPEADRVLDDFDDALMKAVRDYHERQRKLAGDGVAALDSALSRFRYHGEEINGLRRLLRPGERAETVGWPSVKTSTRTISRSEMRDAARPTTWSNDASWARQFIPINQLAQMESEESAAAERAAAPLNHGKNLDFGPSGVRQ